MSCDRKKPGVAFWATVVVVVVLVAYPLSFGPACWINRGTGSGGKAICTVYYPILWAANRSTVIDDAFLWYARLATSKSHAPVFLNRELIWEDWVWSDIRLLKATHRTGPPASRLAPFL